MNKFRSLLQKGNYVSIKGRSDIYIIISRGLEWYLKDGKKIPTKSLAWKECRTIL